MDQIELRERQGHQYAPLSVRWVANMLGMPPNTVHRALIALHRRGEVVWSGRVLPGKKVRLWGRGDNKPHRWPPPKPGPIALPGAREALGAELLRIAVNRAHSGNRNDTGLWLACQLRDKGWSIEQAWCLMEVYVGLVPPGAHPYTFREADASLRQAFKREPRTPFLVSGTQSGTKL